MTLKCPRCRLISPAGAEACDCGHEFATGKIRPPAVRAPVSLSAAHRQVVVDAAVLYRRLVALVAAQALVGFAERVLARALRGSDSRALASDLALVSTLLILGLGLAAAWTAHKVVSDIGVGSPSGWAAGILLSGVIGLLVLNARARRWFEAAGVRFGLLGPRAPDIDRIFSR